MLYKMFFFSRKHLKTVKLFFTEYFPEALLTYFKVSKTFCTCLLLKVYKTFCTCLLLKVYKTFNICLLALLCFSLKVYKTFLNSLLLACFILLEKFLKTFHKPLALKVSQNFYKHGSLGSTVFFFFLNHHWSLGSTDRFKITTRA